jgi:hypothetical protein
LRTKTTCGDRCQSQRGSLSPAPSKGREIL